MVEFENGELGHGHVEIQKRQHDPDIHVGWDHLSIVSDGCVKTNVSGPKGQ